MHENALLGLEELSLIGCSVSSQPMYKEHVQSMFPNLKILDGVPVTAIERRHIQLIHEKPLLECLYTLEIENISSLAAQQQAHVAAQVQHRGNKIQCQNSLVLKIQELQHKKKTQFSPLYTYCDAFESPLEQQNKSVDQSLHMNDSTVYHVQKQMARKHVSGKPAKKEQIPAKPRLFVDSDEEEEEEEPVFPTNLSNIVQKEVPQASYQELLVWELFQGIIPDFTSLDFASTFSHVCNQLQIVPSPTNTVEEHELTQLSFQKKQQAVALSSQENVSIPISECSCEYTVSHTHVLNYKVLNTSVNEKVRTLPRSVGIHVFSAPHVFVELAKWVCKTYVQTQTAQTQALQIYLNTLQTLLPSPKVSESSVLSTYLTEHVELAQILPSMQNTTQYSNIYSKKWSNLLLKCLPPNYTNHIFYFPTSIPSKQVCLDWKGLLLSLSMVFKEEEGVTTTNSSNSNNSNNVGKLQEPSIPKSIMEELVSEYKELDKLYSLEQDRSNAYSTALDQYKMKQNQSQHGITLLQREIETLRQSHIVPPTSPLDPIMQPLLRKYIPRDTNMVLVEAIPHVFMKLEQMLQDAQKETTSVRIEKHAVETELTSLKSKKQTLDTEQLSLGSKIDQMYEQQDERDVQCAQVEEQQSKLQTPSSTNDQVYRTIPVILEDHVLLTLQKEHLQEMDELQSRNTELELQWSVCTSENKGLQKQQELLRLDIYNMQNPPVRSTPCEECIQLQQQITQLENNRMELEANHDESHFQREEVISHNQELVLKQEDLCITNKNLVDTTTALETMQKTLLSQIDVLEGEKKTLQVASSDSHVELDSLLQKQQLDKKKYNTEFQSILEQLCEMKQYVEIMKAECRNSIEQASYASVHGIDQLQEKYKEKLTDMEDRYNMNLVNIQQNMNAQIHIQDTKQLEVETLHEHEMNTVLMEKETYCETITLLNSHIQEKDMTLTEHVETIRKLHASHHETIATLEELQEMELTQIQEDLQIITVKHTELMESHTLLTQTHAQCQLDMRGMQEQVVVLESEVKDLEKTLESAHNTAVQSQTEQSREISIQEQELSVQNAAHEQELDQLHTKLHTLEGQYNQVRLLSKQMMSEHAQLQEHMRSKVTECEELQEKVQTIQKERNDQIEALTLNIKNADKKLCYTENTLESTQVALQDTQTRLLATETKLTETDQTLRDTNSHLDSTRYDFEQTILQYGFEKSTLLSEKDSLNTLLSQHQKDYASEKDQWSRMKQSQTSKMEELGEKEQYLIASMQKMSEDHQRRIVKLQDQVKAGQDKVYSLQNQVHSVENKTLKIEEKLRTSELKTKTGEEKLKLLQDKLIQLTKHWQHVLEEEQSKHVSTQKQCVDLETKVEEGRKELANMQSERSTVQTKLDRAIVDIDTKDTSLQEQKQVIQGLKLKAVDMVHTLGLHEKKCKTLESEIESLLVRQEEEVVRLRETWETKVHALKRVVSKLEEELEVIQAEKLEFVQKISNQQQDQGVCEGKCDKLGKEKMEQKDYMSTIQHTQEEREISLEESVIKYEKQLVDKKKLENAVETCRAELADMVKEQELFVHEQKQVQSVLLDENKKLHQVLKKKESLIDSHISQCQALEGQIALEREAFAERWSTSETSQNNLQEALERSLNTIRALQSQKDPRQVKVDGRNEEVQVDKQKLNITEQQKQVTSQQTQIQEKEAVITQYTQLMEAAAAQLLKSSQKNKALQQELASKSNLTTPNTSISWKDEMQNLQEQYTDNRMQTLLKFDENTPTNDTIHAEQLLQAHEHGHHLTAIDEEDDQDV